MKGLKTGMEPVHVHTPNGKRLVCSIDEEFTKALRHYSDGAEMAYKLLCEYAGHVDLNDGALLGAEHVLRLKHFISIK